MKSVILSSSLYYGFRGWVVQPSSGQDKANSVFWLATRAATILLARDFPRRSRKKKFSFLHIINPILTKLVRLRWINIGLFLFCVLIDLAYVSVHKNTQKNSANILPSWPEQGIICSTVIFFNCIKILNFPKCSIIPLENCPRAAIAIKA